MIDLNSIDQFKSASFLMNLNHLELKNGAILETNNLGRYLIGSNNI